MFVKLKKFFLFSMIAFILSGCQEIEKVQNEDIIEIKENIDFSDVYAPKEVYIYSAQFWEQEDEVIIDAFMEGKYDKAEVVAEGTTYFSDLSTKDERVLALQDEGMAYFGERRIYGQKGGFNYSHMQYVEGCEEYNELKKEYTNSGKMSGNKPDEKDATFIEAKKIVLNKLEKIGMKGYDIDASAVYMADNKKREILIYWKQFIDNIPLSSVGLDSKFNVEHTKVYNSKIYNNKLNSLDSTLFTIFIEDQLVDWSNIQCIDEWKKIKKYPVIPVAKAYQKVKEQFKNGYSGDAAPVLEMTQLQYQTAEINDKIYLYPVWVFVIKTEQSVSIQNENNTETVNDTYWNYYLIDAVSGEYFTDIDTEELEK